MTFPPSPQTFPYRNRIVAGWGCGLLVAEAGLKSGALIPILEEFRSEPLPVWMVYPNSRYVPAKVRLFLDALATSFAPMLPLAAATKRRRKR